MIKMSQSHLDQIIQQAKDSIPIECCGVLAGITQDGYIEVVDIYPMTNVDQSSEHFTLDPKEQFEVYYSIRNKGLKLIGNYHSHPATPARPSDEDIRLAYDQDAVYMIVSLKEEIPVLKSFNIKNGVYTEIPLKITK